MKNAKAYNKAMKKILSEDRNYELEKVIVQRTPQSNLKEKKEKMLEDINKAQLQALGKIPFHSVSKPYTIKPTVDLDLSDITVGYQDGNTLFKALDRVCEKITDKLGVKIPDSIRIDCRQNLSPIEGGLDKILNRYKDRILNKITIALQPNGNYTISIKEK